MTNSADPDLTVGFWSVNLSEPALFAKAKHIWVQKDQG